MFENIYYITNKIGTKSYMLIIIIITQHTCVHTLHSGYISMVHVSRLQLIFVMCANKSKCYRALP